MKLNYARKSCRRRGFSRERHTRSVAIGRSGVIIMWGSLQERRTTTELIARGVTAGNMGRDCSVVNDSKNINT